MQLNNQKEDTSIRFEDSLKQLEKTVAELERGEGSLENQLAQFESGVALSRECLKRLDEIERKVEVLMSLEKGPLPFSEQE